jgi:DNA-directed RNA polymerase specialized sigma24 family protein
MPNEAFETSPSRLRSSRPTRRQWLRWRHLGVRVCIYRAFQRRDTALYLPLHDTDVCRVSHDRPVVDEALHRCVTYAKRSDLATCDKAEQSTDDDALPTPEVLPPGEALRKLLAAESISPASRAVLMLHFEEEMSLPDVAAILEIPLGTAKSRLAYGLKSIRQYLKESGGSHG